MANVPPPERCFLEYVRISALALNAGKTVLTPWARLVTTRFERVFGAMFRRGEVLEIAESARLVLAGSTHFGKECSGRWRIELRYGRALVMG